jgi:hypothetical protein
VFGDLVEKMARLQNFRVGEKSWCASPGSALFGSLTGMRELALSAMRADKQDWP